MQWMGRPLSDLTRQELIEVIETLAGDLRRLQPELPPEDQRLFILARIAELD